MFRPSLAPRVAVAAVVALLVGDVPLGAQARGQRPAPARPAARPAAPAKPAPAPPPKPVQAAPPPAPTPVPPPPEDVRYRAVYTSGGVRTETRTYIKGSRERFEFQDMVLLKQHDQKRTIQISSAANTYFVVPDGAAPAAMPPAAPPKAPGIVMVATTIVDTGERKSIEGRQARRVRTVIDRQPAPGACDTSRQRIETDGWYVDLPSRLPAPAPAGGPPAGGCADQIQATATGDPTVLGFPVAYTTTVTGADGTPVVASMEISELAVTTLDPALFEIPVGMNGANDIRDLSKALSAVNEATLAAADAAPTAAVPPRTPGVVRIGVPEFGNKTAQTVDTRALRQRLITGLAELKVEAVPMAAATPAELQSRASQLGYDYLLLAEVTELKASKPGRFGGLLKAASGVAGGRAGAAGAIAGAAGAAAAPQETTESTLAVKLLQPDGKQRLSTTAKGKDGSGFSLQTGLGLAKFAGGMYLSMFAGPQMFARLSSLGAANLGGMGVLGNPMLHQMQVGGLAAQGRSMGVDATAGAASLLMQQAMAMNDLGGLVGAPGQGPSYDESLGEAVQNAAKAVQKALQK